MPLIRLLILGLYIHTRFAWSVACVYITPTFQRYHHRADLIDSDKTIVWLLILVAVKALDNDRENDCRNACNRNVDIVRPIWWATLSHGMSTILPVYNFQHFRTPRFLLYYSSFIFSLQTLEHNGDDIRGKENSNVRFHTQSHDWLCKFLR